MHTKDAVMISVDSGCVVVSVEDVELHLTRSEARQLAVNIYDAAELARTARGRERPLVRCMDAIDGALALDAEQPARLGACIALTHLYEFHCPRCIGEGAGEQIPGEAIGLIRESLELALAALDLARHQVPSGPRGLVS